ncbi:uncharacterized protein YALI1_E14353g [Yarrowia lipolytica]|uniref:Uncharacterized protein n=1 Tax=Yarrowia lipolytica TaxID=4952 RepID=A0A1D8NI22_YARLL|nr:hypothetical protein YALI1_E14353g [Yarrowia lipolytica]
MNLMKTIPCLQRAAKKQLPLVIQQDTTHTIPESDAQNTALLALFVSKSSFHTRRERVHDSSRTLSLSLSLSLSLRLL